jgi:hypothetical protein
MNITLERIVVTTALTFMLQVLPAWAEPQTGTAGGASKEAPRGSPRSPRPLSADELCRELAQAAVDNDLPVEFFTRLIWQESRFDPGAVSSKGAQGIAQFMPGTASGRGLIDPFEPRQALRESASYLRELRTTFDGRLGLAAAAYNAGPGRIEAWRAGRRSLPAETRAYVRIITGHTAEAWAADPPPLWANSAVPRNIPCAEMAALIAPHEISRPKPTPNPAWGPWGVQLAGNWSEGKVLATYERLRREYHAVLRERLPLILRARLPGARGASKYLVRVSESSRPSAEALCTKLRSAGGACIVLRNPRTASN